MKEVSTPIPSPMDRLWRDRPRNRLVTCHRVTTHLRTCSRLSQVLSNEIRTSWFTLTMTTTTKFLWRLYYIHFILTLLLSLIHFLCILLCLWSRFILRLFFHPFFLHHIIRHEVMGKIPNVQREGSTVPPNLPQVHVHLTEFIPQPLNLHQKPPLSFFLSLQRPSSS